MTTLAFPLQVLVISWQRDGCKREAWMRNTTPASFRSFLGLLLLFALLHPNEAAAGNKFLSVKTWDGQSLQGKQGGAYLTYHLPFKQANATPLQLTLVNGLNQKSYLLAIKGTSLSAPAGFLLFKLPAGKYLLTSARIQEQESKPRLWLPSSGREAPSFIVKRGAIANFGVLDVTRVGTRALHVGIKANLEALPQPLLDQPRYAIYNAHDGTLQLAADARQSKPHDLPPEEPSHGRSISAKWTVELAQEDTIGEDIKTALNRHTREVRTCYTLALAKQKTLAGSLVLSFALSKNNGRFLKIRQMGGNLSDPEMVGCLTNIISGLHLAVTRSSFGKLTLEFSAS